MTVHERILDVDDEHRRVAYVVLDAPGLTYHHASMQIEIAGPGRCAFVWTTDFLPAEAASSLQPLIDQGSDALKRNARERRLDPARERRAAEVRPATDEPSGATFWVARWPRPARL